MKLVAAGDWMVVVTKRIERKTDGGLIMPEATFAEDEGVVESVGPDVKRAKVGDRIVFIQCRSKHGHNYEHRYIVRDEHVVATIQD